MVVTISQVEEEVEIIQEVGLVVTSLVEVAGIIPLMEEEMVVTISLVEERVATFKEVEME